MNNSMTVEHNEDTFDATLTVRSPRAPFTHLLTRITPIRTRTILKLWETRNVTIHTWHIEIWPLNAPDDDTAALAALVAQQNPPTITFQHTAENLDPHAIIATVAAKHKQ